jgi:hypothetical protein
MLKVTAILDMLHPAGTPETVRLLVAPLRVLSGIITLIGPDATLNEAVDEVEAINLTAGSPRHMVTDEGVMFGAGGV